MTAPQSRRNDHGELEVAALMMIGRRGTEGANIQIAFATALRGRLRGLNSTGRAAKSVPSSIEDLSRHNVGVNMAKMGVAMSIRRASRFASVLVLASTVGGCAIDQSVSSSDKRNPLDAFASALPDNQNCADRSSLAGTDRYCVSSVLPKDEVNVFYYGPRSLFDHANHTAWVEGVDGQGIGEWITIEFDQLRRIDGIEINNGYNKGSELYLKNSRIKKLKVEFFRDGKRISVLSGIELKDTSATQEISPPKDQIIKADKVKFTIEGIYPGTKFEDTAVSELHISTEATQP